MIAATSSLICAMSALISFSMSAISARPMHMTGTKGFGTSDAHGEGAGCPLGLVLEGGTGLFVQGAGVGLLPDPSSFEVGPGLSSEHGTDLLSTGVGPGGESDDTADLCSSGVGAG